MEETSGVLDGIVSLPEGGGSIGGLGEQFQPDLLKGTGNYAVPLELPENPTGPTPELSLKYSTGLGNGPFGLGWTLGGTREIRRATSDGVPTYDGTDDFVMTGSGPLVEVEPDRYRPAADREYRDVRRLDRGWRIRTKEGEEFTLGTTDGSRVTDGERVFAWLVDEHRDPAGNAVSYEYERRGNAVYLAAVEWGPFALRFEYESRPDPVRFGRAGFPVTTGRRCSRVEHHCETLEDTLVTRWDLTYEQAEGSALSLLVSVEQTAFDGEATESRPALTMDYRRPDPADVDLVRVESRDRLPDLSREEATLLDMSGDGLPDVLRTGPGGHVRWPNEGDGTFGVRRALSTAHPGLTLGEDGVSLGDLNGDGAVDLFRVRGGIGMTVQNTGTGAWADRPTVYARQVPLDLRSTRSRLTDLDGDGVVDLLQSGPGGFTLTYNDDGEGWERPFSVSRYQDDAVVPDVGLDGPRINVADMTGDGLGDLVFVDDGRVQYWPYYGHGNWGEPVRVSNPPSLPAGFDRDRLYLADIDRDGAADLVYVDVDSVYCWLNRSGEGFSDRYEVPFVPPPDPDSVHLADLTGAGVQGLVWSGGGRADRRDTGYRYLEFNGGEKPYLLTSVDDGTGGITEVEYTTTTTLRRDADEPWDTYLPFPVHVVDAYVERDGVTDRTRRTELTYHRGSYDPEVGEFRGFERVELTVVGDDHTPTVTNETVFAQPAADGAAGVTDAPAVERARERALAGLPEATRTYEVAPDGTRTLRKRTDVTWETRLDHEDGDEFVHFPHATGVEVRNVAPGERDRIEATAYEYDEYGNVVRRVARSRFGDQSPSEAEVTERTVEYVENEAAWLVGLPASLEVRDGDGNLHRHVRRFYDGPDFQGLPEGEADDGLLRRVRKLFLADWALPPDYADSIDRSWGLVHEGEGYYRDVDAFRHDDDGKPVTIRDSLGDERSISYDDVGFPRQVSEADGSGGTRTATVSFDHRTAQPARVDFPEGTVAEYTYTPMGRLAAHEETVGDGSLAPTRVFQVDVGDGSDLSNRPPSATSIVPRTTDLSTADLLAADPASLDGVDVARSYFDGRGNRLQEVRTGSDADDGSRRWIAAKRRTHTVRGDIAAEFPNEFVDDLAYYPDLPTDEATTYRYGVDDRTVRIEHGDGRRLRIDHYPDRREKRDPGVPDSEPPVVERIDARGNLVAVKEPTGDGGVATTEYEVGASGRITAITDPSGRVAATYTYAGPGDPIRISHADAGRRTYWRDARSNLRVRTDDIGRRIEFEYDALGRATAVTDASDPDAPETVRELTYEGSRLVEARDGDVRVRFDHDATGRPTQKTVEFADGETLSLVREYTRQGRVDAITYPDGTRVAYDRDDTGSGTAVSGFVDDVTYDAADRTTEMRFPSGARTEYEHDRTDRLGRASLVGPDGDELRTVEYEYDDRDNVAELRDRFPDAMTTRQFAYDRRYQLTEASYYDGDPTGTPRRTDTYDYSPTGDLVRNDESFAGPMRYDDPDHAGRLTAVQSPGTDDPTPLDYDDGGRLTGYGDLEDLTYDVFDRLVEVTKADGTVVRFDYDHEGTRVETVVGSGDDAARTRSVEDLYESDADGEHLRVLLGEVPVAARVVPDDDDASTVSLLTDHLGSVIAAVDGSGAPAGQQLYTPYGKPLRTPSGPGAEELSRFIGLEPDPGLGLAQFGDRYYAAELGRFITPDWFVIQNPGPAKRFPRGLNAYGYAVNNPLRFRDPSGKIAFIAVVGIAAAAGFVVGMAAGTAAGRARGESWGQSLLRGLEAGLLGAAGLALGVGAGVVAGGLIGGLASFGVLGHLGGAIAGGLIGGIVGGAIGGINGIVSGANRIYSLDGDGFASFLADSTWGLFGTGLGLLVHGANLFDPNSRYRPHLSERQNRHVYDGGFAINQDFAFTQGNVISNLEGARGALLRHEMLHVHQSRIFGPIYQGTYLGFAALGLVLTPIFTVGAYAFSSDGTGQDMGQDIQDMAYRNNPWEIWATENEPETAGGGSLSVQ